MLRDKVIPLYYQLETVLRQKISNGDFLPQSPLPSEEMIAAEYQVSRITVRQALSSLEKDGLIVRHRGKGTFVSEKVNHLELPRFTGSIEDLVLLGIQTRLEVLDYSWVIPPVNIQERLELEDSKVLRIEKIRHTQDGPLSYVLNYVPENIGRNIKKTMARTKPMMVILQEDLGIELTEADQVMEAAIADTFIANLLKVRVGDPLLRAERVVYDDKSRPVEYVSVQYRADRFKFTMKLRRKSSSGYSVWGAV